MYNKRYAKAFANDPDMMAIYAIAYADCVDMKVVSPDDALWEIIREYDQLRAYVTTKVLLGAFGDLMDMTADELYQRGVIGN